MNELEVGDTVIIGINPYDRSLDIELRGNFGVVTGVVEGLGVWVEVDGIPASQFKALGAPGGWALTYDEVAKVEA